MKTYTITFFRRDGWGMYDKKVPAESPELASAWANDWLAKNSGVHSFDIRNI